MKLYRFVTYGLEDVAIVCEDYGVIKETPAGYWIEDWSAKKGRKWVSKTGYKRFAYVSKADAAVSFVARKKRYIEILKARTEAAETALAFFDKNKEEFVAGPKTLLIAYNLCLLEGLE